MAGKMILRADATSRLGTGHVMRCVALAEAWRAAGGRAVFLSHCSHEPLRRRIRRAGAELIDVPRPHPDPGDLRQVRSLLDRTVCGRGSSEPFWVVLDGYHFDPGYQQAIRNTGARLLVVDDLAHLPDYRADVVLNQNVTAGELDYRCDPATTLLLGCRYALLRTEFMPWQAHKRETPATAHRVLVTLGGSDPDNVTCKVLEALEQIDVPDLEVKVVVGAANPHLSAIRRRLAQWAKATTGGSDADTGERPVAPARPNSGEFGYGTRRIELLTNAENMPELMAWAHMAVSAAGSTCWELALMQLPAAVVVLADNQAAIAKRLAQLGVVTHLGRASQFDPQAAAKTLASLCHDQERRAGQSAAAGRLVDGQGARRVVAVLGAVDGSISLGQAVVRPANVDDLRPIWRLVNDPTVREASLSTEPIPLDEHTAWFQGKLADAASRIWVLEYEGVLLAVGRYDRTEPGTAEISIYTAAAFRRRGLAGRLLRETQPQAAEQLGVTRFQAVVRQENSVSARTFTKAGFELIDSRDVRGCPCHVFERPA